ncbi:aldo/keto reductase [Paracoccus sulfuroxidans]|uniref:Aryl-alcohol dehydrogenase-like predicted oxidoreductase n=1 Tax=Paracoccus sulfuroxidans TaxID=384678 RepID=A0A562NVV1_9RHOB|nr:aldo/keto reductase [Paracoccus sulfuroxidans]TWI35836.1 aryl-alcohol dehydrogenase-like predicted oxidoreductase [Paracoccus sulfuroxidans]
MQKRALGRTGLSIAPLVFGGNVFGWTADEKTSFDLLDAFVDHGFNAIDTADVYSSWAPGNSGGESETVIGRWLKARPGMRERVVIFTKVGSDLGQPGQKGLSARWIAEAVEGSLRRLQTDRIDLYFSHWADPETPYAETLGAYDALLKAGKIGAIGASNLDAAQLGEALQVSRDQGLPAYQVLQPEYNLYSRDSFEGPLADLCIREGVGVVNYYGLAAGFLTGKYRTQADVERSSRSNRIGSYMNPKGQAILAALDQVAKAHGAQPAEVALAWLMTRPGVTAPIASATSLAQLAPLMKSAELSLTAEDLAALDRASA